MIHDARENFKAVKLMLYGNKFKLQKVEILNN